MGKQLHSFKSKQKQQNSEYVGRIRKYNTRLTELSQLLKPWGVLISYGIVEK